MLRMRSQGAGVMSIFFLMAGGGSILPNLGRSTAVTWSGEREAPTASLLRHSRPVALWHKLPF